MEAVLATSQLGAQLLSLANHGIQFYQDIKGAEKKIQGIRSELDHISMVLRLGQHSIDTFQQALSQENRDNILTDVDFQALLESVTTNAEQARAILTKAQQSKTVGKFYYVTQQRLLQGILATLNRCTNTYTTAIITIMVNCIVLMNVSISENFAELNQSLGELKEAQIAIGTAFIAEDADSTTVSVRSTASRDPLQLAESCTTSQSSTRSSRSKKRLTHRISDTVAPMRTLLRKSQKRTEGSELINKISSPQLTTLECDNMKLNNMTSLQPTDTSVHSTPRSNLITLNQADSEANLMVTNTRHGFDGQVAHGQASAQTSPNATTIEALQALESSADLRGEVTISEATHEPGGHKPGEVSPPAFTLSPTAGDSSTPPQRDSPDLRFVFQETEMQRISQRFGRLENIMADGTSMASATNDSSPWIFVFFQRSDNWVQLALFPKDYRSRIIALDSIAEAVEQTPLSCTLTSPEYQDRSILRLFFVQISEGGKKTLVERRLDLKKGPPFEWDVDDPGHDAPIRIPANVFQWDPFGSFIHVSEDGELLALERGGEAYWSSLPSPDICVLPGETIFIKTWTEPTGYWQFPFSTRPDERTVVGVYTISHRLLTRYMVRNWLDDRSTEPQILKEKIPLDWSGLAISPLPNSYFPLLNWENDDDEEESETMFGFYCRTRDDKVFYFTGHYADELGPPEFVCTVKAGSQIHFLSECLDLLYLSAENELKVARRHVDSNGTSHHEHICLPGPANYFLSDLNNLVAPGPLDEFIPPQVQKVVSERDQEEYGGFRS